MNEQLHKDVSKKGGQSTLEKHGKEHFATMGKLGSKKQREMYGDEYYKKLSQAGVEGRKRKRQEKKEAEINSPID